MLFIIMEITNKKIYWVLNVLLAVLTFIVLMTIFAIRYYNGYPCIEETWTLEFFKYVVMWFPITVSMMAICYVPFKMLAGYLNKKLNNKD